MSGGSDFEMLKMQLFNALAELARTTERPETLEKIHQIQRQIAALEEF